MKRNIIAVIVFIRVMFAILCMTRPETVRRMNANIVDSFHFFFTGP